MFFTFLNLLMLGIIKFLNKTVDFTAASTIKPEITFFKMDATQCLHIHLKLLAQHKHQLQETAKLLQLHELKFGRMMTISSLLGDLLGNISVNQTHQTSKPGARKIVD